ncbi:phage tail protein [Chitinophagaceae bacterium MMS25-I14]
MEGTMAVVTPWAANFAPGGWMFCQGQSMSIAANTALFALIGTIYGGDGQQTFNLPDMQGRVAIGAGQGPGLSNYELGEKGGTEQNTLTMSQMAGHTHPFTVTSQVPVNADSTGSKTPVSTYPASASGNIYNTTPGAGQFAGALSVNTQIGITGNGIPVNNIKPILCVNYIICVEGIFPSRN